MLYFPTIAAYMGAKACMTMSWMWPMTVMQMFMPVVPQDDTRPIR